MIPVLSRALTHEFVDERHRQADARRRARPVKPDDRIQDRRKPVAAPALRRPQEDAS